MKKKYLTLWTRLGRLTFLGLLFQCLALSALLASQSNIEKAESVHKARIVINMQNASVKHAFSMIEANTEFRFAFDNKDLNNAVSLNLPNGEYTVGDVLMQIAKQTNLSFKQINNTIYVRKDEKPNATEAIEVILEGDAGNQNHPLQEVTVSGTVTSLEDGSPLPGVNVLIKGIAMGTTTDISGNYTIKAPGEDAVLIFSFIGFTSEEVTIGARSVIDMALAPDIQYLSEVVVIGYGEQSKRNVTGSISKVEMEQLEMQPNTNVTQALRGKVAGVQFLDDGRPGQSGEILIRGQRSINAGNDPLIILDGAFFNGELADINPNDIESMEILKDASAAAIYGSRAANGVILITSKQGQSEKPTIRFNAYYGVSDWSHKLDLYGPESYLQRRADFMEQNNITPNPSNPYDLEANELEMLDNGTTIDPWEEISQSAQQQSYNISVSGQTDRTNYFISGNYTKEEGLIYGDKASRLSARVNLENEIADWLTIGLNSQYAQRDESGVNANVRQAYWLSPYAKLYNEDAESGLVYYPVFGETLVQNPLFNSWTMDNEEVYNNLFANMYALIEVPFIEGLSYRLSYNPNLRWERDYSFWPIFQQEGVRNNGQGRKINVNRWNWQLENILTYKKEFGKHAFDLTLVYGIDHGEQEETMVQAQGFPNDRNSYHNLGIAATITTDTEASRRDGISSMARLNYRFNERYLLTGTVRRDGSSVFGDNYKYGVFPSVAAAWIMTDEPWMDVSFLDMLKLRVSYGEVGNQSISSYSSLDRLDSENYVFGDGSNTYVGLFPSPDFMPNPNLRWESTVSANFAVDFSMLRDRVWGTVEYYNMNTDDLLLYRSLPDMTGFYGIFTNLAATSNKGLEVTLNTVNVRNNDFEWGSSIVFATNKNRIERLYGSDTDGDGVEDDDIGNEWFIGQPIDVNYDYVFDGIYQEGDEDIPTGYQPGWVRVKDINDDGEITPADRTVLSQRQPKYRWGFNNDISYKGFTLSFFINGMSGFEKDNNLLDVSNYFGYSYPGRSLNFLDAGYWTPENRSNTRPSLNYTNPLGMSFYQSRNFIRLQDVTLAYNLPQSLLERINISNLRVYVSGRNLLTLTDWQGTDPESGYSTIEDLYPTSRTIIGGINLSF